VPLRWAYGPIFDTKFDSHCCGNGDSRRTAAVDREAKCFLIGVYAKGHAWRESGTLPMMKSTLSVAIGLGGLLMGISPFPVELDHISYRGMFFYNCAPSIKYTPNGSYYYACGLPAPEPDDNLSTPNISVEANNQPSDGAKTSDSSGGVPQEPILSNFNLASTMGSYMTFGSPVGESIYAAAEFGQGSLASKKSTNRTPPKDDLMSPKVPPQHTLPKSAGLEAGCARCTKQDLQRFSGQAKSLVALILRSSGRVDRAGQAHLPIGDQTWKF
jgi:hypothetical protein